MQGRYLVNSKAARLLQETEHLGLNSVVIEIGSLRSSQETPSDGWSTYYLAQRANERLWEFISIDNNPETSQLCRNVLGREGALGARIHILTDDGALFLQSWSGAIDCLYIDGAASPEEAMAQFEAAEHSLHVGSVILIDDIQSFAEAGAQGKGTLLVPALVEKGWQVDIVPTEPGFLMAVVKN